MNWQTAFRCLCVFGCLAAGLSSLTAADKDESWQTIYIGKQRVGFAHITVEEVTRNGKQVTICDNLNQMTINRFGFTLHMSVVQTTEEDSNGNMLGFKFTIDNPPTSKIESRGTVADGKLTTTTISAGRTRSTEAAWDATVKSPAWIDRVLQKEPLKQGDKRDFRMYDPQFSKAVTITVTHKGKAKTTLLDGSEVELDQVITRHSNVPGLVITSYIGTDGETVKSETNLLGMTTYASTKEEALKAVTGESLDLGLDTVIATGSIPKAHESRKAVYKISVDGHLNEALSEGPTQSLKAESDTQGELTVRAIKPGEPGNEPAPGPEYLATSQFMDLDDPRVKALAKEGAGDLKDPVEIAVALEKFVRARVSDKNFSTALATASEVARDLAGDCTEHAVLLAALLRANKIPSRVVIGFVYADFLEGFGGHMWTEAYLNGQWVPLDATLGKGGIGVGHIKVTDADLSENSAAPVGAFVPIIHLLGKTRLELKSIE